MKRLVALFAVVCLACGDDDEQATVVDAPLPVDAAVDARGIDASQTQICVDLVAEFNAIVTPLSRSCDTADDCTLVGGKPGQPSCNCAATLGADCAGTAVNKAAAAGVLPRLTALKAEFDPCVGQACSSGIPCICDCPGGQVTLTCESHTCGLHHEASCFPAPPDANMRD